MLTTTQTTVRSFEEYTDAARELLDKQDENRWRLGEIVSEVQTHYGEHSVLKLCEQAKGRPSTLYEYAQVYRFYPHGIWQEYPLVRWSQWRRAMSLKDVKQAIALIERANDENMQIAEFEELVKDPDSGNSAARKIFDDIVIVKRRGNTISFVCSKPLVDGENYRIKISKVEKLQK